jgi:hypothetical protein
VSIEGMRVAWQELATALDEFYELAQEPLRERARLGDDGFAVLAVLAELAGPMVRASEAIRSEAEEELAHNTGADRERVSELLLAGATLDLVLATDLAVLEPITIGRTPAPSISAVFDTLALESEAHLAEIPSPREIFAEGQETIGQIAVLFAAIPALGGGEHRPRSRSALIGDARDAVVNLVDLAESPGSELVKGFTSNVGTGIRQVFDAAARGETVKRLRAHVGGIVGHSPKFLREHIAKIVSLCPEAWIVDEATSALSEKLSVRKVLARISASDVASERSRDWIEHTPQLRWPAIDDLRRDLDSLEGRYKKQTKLIRKSARVLRFGSVPLSRVALASLGPPGLAVVPGVFALSTGYLAYSLTDRLDARDLGVADLVSGVVRLVEARVDRPPEIESSPPDASPPRTSPPGTTVAEKQQRLREKANAKKFKIKGLD